MVAKYLNSKKLIKKLFSYKFLFIIYFQFFAFYSRITVLSRKINILTYNKIFKRIIFKRTIFST